MENLESTIEKKGLVQRAKDTMKYHIVDSTAIISESTPIYASFETFIAGMSNNVSMNTRLLAATSCYAGLGWVYGKGRDASRKLFKIDDKTKERYQQLHDAAYSASFNTVMSPIFYLLAGARDAKEIAIGTLCGTAFGLINGGPMGFAVDAFRDLTGLKASERIPKLVKRQNSKIKKCLAELITAGTIALTSAIYSTSPDNQTQQKTQQKSQDK